MRSGWLARCFAFLPSYLPSGEVSRAGSCWPLQWGWGVGAGGRGAPGLPSLNVCPSACCFLLRVSDSSFLQWAWAPGALRAGRIDLLDLNSLHGTQTGDQWAEVRRETPVAI